MFGRLIARFRRRTLAHLYPDAGDQADMAHDFQQRKRARDVAIVRGLRLAAEAEERRHIKAALQAAAEHRRQMLAGTPTPKPKRSGWLWAWKR